MIGRLLYECYQPRTLAETKEYLDFVLTRRSILPNELSDPGASVSAVAEPRPDFNFTARENGGCDPPQGRLGEYLRLEREKRADPRVQQYLWFDSAFECANLHKVIAVSPTEYELYLSSDTNAANRTQWFYFLVSNTKKDVAVRFTLMNQTKAPYFFNEGMKPLVFSEKDNRAIYVSWAARTTDTRISKIPAGKVPVGGRTIALTQAEVSWQKTLAQLPARYQPCGGSGGGAGSKDVPGSYHVLSFSHTFKYDGDRVYFAFAKPYGYTMLRKYISQVETETARKYEGTKVVSSEPQTKEWELPGILLESPKLWYRRELLCRSLGGLPVHVMTITSPQGEGINKTKYVVISARVHASETPGSCKVQGIISFLLSDSPVAEALRNEFVFLIVPMMNPDGVVLGNNRCSLAGYDLNRCWSRPLRSKQPTVYALKRRMRELVAEGRQICVFCDLHGHSKQLNSFIYACHSADSGTFSSWTRVRLLPRIMAKRCHLLDYHQCRFKVESAKMSTARVIVWREFKVANSFTLESSMYAYTIGDELVRFSEREYSEIGEALMHALNDYRILLDEFQEDTIGGKDWLKSSKLLELSGVPAADLLKNEIREDREEEGKRARGQRLQKIRGKIECERSNTKLTDKEPAKPRVAVINSKTRAGALAEERGYFSALDLSPAKETSLPQIPVESESSSCKHKADSRKGPTRESEALVPFPELEKESRLSQPPEGVTESKNFRLDNSGYRRNKGRGSWQPGEKTGLPQDAGLMHRRKLSVEGNGKCGHRLPDVVTIKSGTSPGQSQGREPTERRTFVLDISLKCGQRLRSQKCI